LENHEGRRGSGDGREVGSEAGTGDLVTTVGAGKGGLFGPVEPVEDGAAGTADEGPVVRAVVERRGFPAIETGFHGMNLQKMMHLGDEVWRYISCPEKVSMDADGLRYPQVT